MGVTGIGIGIGIGPFDLSKPSGSALDVITSSNGAWWVVAERDGSDNLVDQTGGGRHLTLPGGSANPVLLDHTGTDYIFLPGTSGNYLSVPDSAAVSVTGDLDVIWHGRLADYTPATNQSLVAKYGTTTAAQSWFLQLAPSGIPVFRVRNASLTSEDLGATAAVGFSDNTDGWIRLTFDVSTSTARFYTSTDGSSWTQLGADVVGTLTDILDGTGAVTVGMHNNSNYTQGRIYRAIIKDGIDGTTVLDVNASDADPDATTFTESSSNAATVTINRSSTGYCTEVVDQPGYSFATDDYLYAADDALFDIGASDEFTAGLVVRVHGTPGSDYALITKKNTTSGTDAGWSLQENTAGKLDARVADGTASPDKVTASAVTDHVLIAASIVRDATTVGAYDPSTGSIETASDTTTGTLANAQQLRVGADGGGADFLRGFVVGGFFLKDTARTAAQIDGLSDALITANGGTP